MSYDITFQVDPNSEDFECQEEIDIEVIETVDKLQLHLQNLQIAKLEWNSNAVDYTIDETNHLLIIDLNLPAGTRGTLTVHCAGLFAKDMYGIYRSAYEDFDDLADSPEEKENSSTEEKENSPTEATGNSPHSQEDAPVLQIAALNLENSQKEEENQPNAETQYLVSTQFEPIGARRAFPCIDDPAAKSQFTITLVYPKGFTALLNCAAEVTTEVNESLEKTRFAQSPLMSTYLVAFVVGKLESLKSEILPITAWTLPGGAEEAYFALQAAEKCLPYCEKVFAYDYPLAKLDLVAIPEMSNSAMENFGIIFFKESDFLVDPTHISQHQKEVTFETVAHEISHQWFGNLVTMDFWDDLWLNEGFATWFLWHTMHHFHPEWNVWQNFVVYTQQTAMTVDFRPSAHPVVMPILSLTDIEQASDDITYQKGCSLIVMLAEFVGVDQLFTGLQSYIRKFAWANARSADLWECLGSVDGNSIASIMNCWIEKPGFPTIQISDLENGVVQFEQRKSSPLSLERDEQELYVIPMTVELLSGQRKFVFSEKRTQVTDFDLSSVLNPGHKGYFITYHTEQTRLNVVASSISTLDKLGVIMDYDFGIASGLLLITAHLELVEEWFTIDDPVLLNAIIESYFGHMDAFLFDSVAWNGICKIGQDLVAKTQLSAVLNSPEPASTGVDEEIRLSWLRFAAYVRSPLIDEYCDRKFQEYVDGEKDLDADTAKIIVRNKVRRADLAEWRTIVETYRREDNEFVKDDILMSLGNSQNEIILQEFLDLVFNLKLQDMLMCLGPVLASSEGVSALWKWMTTKWDQLSSKLIHGSHTHLNFIEMCMSGFSTREQRDEVLRFFEDKDPSLFKRMVAKICEKIEVRFREAERNQKAIHAWLLKNRFPL